MPSILEVLLDHGKPYPSYQRGHTEAVVLLPFPRAVEQPRGDEEQTRGVAQRVRTGCTGSELPCSHSAAARPSESPPGTR